MSKKDLEKEILFLESLCTKSSTSEKEKREINAEVQKLRKRLSHLNSINEDVNSSYSLNG